MAANDSLVLQIKTDKNFDDLRIGFYQASNPSGFKRMQSFAALNAARTMLKPMKQAAPKGETTENPGRLQKERQGSWRALQQAWRGRGNQGWTHWRLLRLVCCGRQERRAANQVRISCSTSSSCATIRLGYGQKGRYNRASNGSLLCDHGEVPQ